MTKQYQLIALAVSSVLVLVLLLWLLAGGFADAQPWSPILISMSISSMAVVWSLFRLFRAPHVPLVARMFAFVGYSVIAVTGSISAVNLIRFSNGTTSLITNVPLPLIMVGVVLLPTAQLIEAGWGKTNVRAWIRVTLTAMVAACALFLILFGWILIGA